MIRPIVTAEEKCTNATSYCTLPSPTHYAKLKTLSSLDFAFLAAKLEGGHMKTFKQGSTKLLPTPTT
jgi:hypothetical protein